MLTSKQKQIYNGLTVKEREAIVAMAKPHIRHNRSAWNWWAGYKQAIKEAEDICLQPKGANQ